MELSELTKRLADEYFSLTGRPLATMTVAEFKEFRNLAKQENASVSIDTPVVKTVASVEQVVESKPQTKPEPPKEPQTEKIVEKNISEKPRIYKPISHTKSEDGKNAETSAPDNTNAMLAMLKSVPG